MAEEQNATPDASATEVTQVAAAEPAKPTADMIGDIQNDAGSTKAQVAQKAQDAVEKAGDTPLFGENHLEPPESILSEKSTNFQSAGDGAPKEYQPFREKVKNETGQVVEQFVTHEPGDDAMHDQFVKECQSMGLSQEQAQERRENLMEWAERFGYHLEQQNVKQANEWNKQSQERGLFNNPQVSLDFKNGLRAIDDRNGTFAKDLDKSGLIHHPMMIAALVAVGRGLTTGGQGTTMNGAAPGIYGSPATPARGMGVRGVDVDAAAAFLASEHFSDRGHRN